MSFLPSPDGWYSYQACRPVLTPQSTILAIYIVVYTDACKPYTYVRYRCMQAIYVRQDISALLDRLLTLGA